MACGTGDNMAAALGLGLGKGDRYLLILENDNLALLHLWSILKGEASAVFTNVRDPLEEHLRMAEFITPKVVLIEAATPPASAPSWDERCIALNDASQQILGRFGVWDALLAAAEPILATHISEKGRFGSTRFTAAEAGLAALGYNVPLRAIGAVLTAAMAGAMTRVSSSPKAPMPQPRLKAKPKALGNQYM